MSSEGDHHVLRIEEKLARLSSTASEHCIFRVHNRLRKENERAYEPEIVAIGPYHRGKKNLEEMEQHKLRYLQLLLKQRNESSVHRYVMAMREYEERARKCYAETISLDKNEFVEMLLLDGCFIIQFFHKITSKVVRDMDPNDPINLSQIGNVIRRDLLLFENQLPFFILNQLFNMTKTPDSQANIIDVALKSLNSIFPGPNILERSSASISIDNVNHLLGLMHGNWCSSFAEMIPRTNAVEKWEFILCTTELQEAGIKFKQAEESISLLDIKFKNGVMEIPPLHVEDDTERIFRNLIAYEQYLREITFLPITDYVKFMDCLINSAKDVETLRHCGIIKNWLGDDEAVSTMFNKLGNNVWMNDEIFCYPDVFNNVNKHCGKQWNIWMAKLRRNYFNSPWAIISFLAGVVLLLLSFTQTVFSIL